MLTVFISFFSIFLPIILFMPLALGISTSYNLLRATDMSLDGSFVLGAVCFTRLLNLGTPPLFACFIALLAGAFVGIFVSFVQRGGRVDSLLAGILVAFILTSVNLIILGRPNMRLSSQYALFPQIFAKTHPNYYLWLSIFVSLFILLVGFILLQSKFGLRLRALGDNSFLLEKMGYNVELYRTAGFAFTNSLAAASGILTAQFYGYADTSMGLGMTLTGICAILLGQQCTQYFIKSNYYRNKGEFFACFFGVCLYFVSIDILLRFDISTIYLKMLLGFVLIFFLRHMSKGAQGNKAV